MFQSTLKRLFCVAALAAVITLASSDSAQAGWHHWGGHVGWGYGGYHASYYAPSYYVPAYSVVYRRPCLSRYAYYSPVVYSRYSCYRPAYRSCYPSCCGTCYGPCTCSSYYVPSTSCCDSTTTVQKYSTPSEPTPAPQEPAATPQETPPAPAPIDSLPPDPAPDGPTSTSPDSNSGAAPALDLPPLPGDAQNQSGTDSAVLSVVVPEDARVYVNGRLTQTPGTNRQYVSHGLVQGYEYTYEIRAVVNRGGRIVTDKQLVSIRAGETRSLAMSLNPSPAPVAIATSLIIRVPEDAQVQLEGQTTKATGAVREFSTMGLAKGERWDDYRVVVTMNHNGRPVTQEKTLSMIGGEAHELQFDFDPELLAAR